MLDFADVVAINKFERRGAEDALRDVRRQIGPQPRARSTPTPTSCRCSARSPSRFNDDGVTALYQHLRGRLRRARACPSSDGHAAAASTRKASHRSWRRSCRRPAPRYLAEIAETVRGYHARTDEQVARGPAPSSSCAGASDAAAPAATAPTTSTARGAARRGRRRAVDRRRAGAARRRGRRRHVARAATGRIARLPRVAVGHAGAPGRPAPLRRRRRAAAVPARARTCPGSFPFTAGVFPFKREGEDPARMFAGEGDAFRTNRRFHLLAEGQPATRLSTAFDSVTLYGFDPDERPDIYGKVGNSGVSIATLDDMKVLYDGFDLCDPTTSVSMTINGPAPTILAMFLNTAIDQRSTFAEHGRATAPRCRSGRTLRRAGHGAGRHPQGGPGPEHLHLLHRVRPRGDGRHPGVVRRARGAQLLLGVDLRLPHRRGGREPHHPARVHAGQRLHLRRGLPRPGHGRRRLRPQPHRSSSPTAWTPSTPCSAGSPGASGPSPCATATAPTSAARS